MPGNFGIPSDGAQLSLLAEVTDGNSELLESVIAALLHPISVTLTDNECLLARVSKNVRRILGQSASDNDTQLRRIVDALYAHLALLSGANQSELDRALAYASQLNQAGDVDPITLVAQQANAEIQQILLNDTPPPVPPDIHVDVNQFGQEQPPPLTPEQQDAVDIAAQFGIHIDVGGPAPVPTGPTIPCGVNGSPIELPAILAKGLPLPGSDAWYDQLDAYIAGFDVLGELIIGWINDNFNVGNLQEWFERNSADKRLAKSGDLWSLATYKAFQWLISNSQPVFELIKGAIRCAWESAKVLVPTCNLKVVVGITVVRAVIRTLSDIEGGWDAFVWAIAHVRMELPVAESMLDSLLQYACPMGVPSPEQATEAWAQGRLTEERRNLIWKWHGFNPDTYDVVARSRLERVDPREYLQYLRRTDVTVEGQIQLLTERVFQNKGEATAFVELYQELPTINDHLHWLQRNVFDDAYVQQYDLMNGFDTRFWPKFGHDLTSLGMKKEYAALHYAAHWINAAPEQMREWVYRLRTDKPGVQQPFTAEDYERLLAEQDYSPKQRAWFAETLYRVPALGYLRDMFRQNIIGQDELRGYHQDLGYSHADSERFVQIDNIQRLRMRASQGHGWTTAAIAQAYGTRQRDRDWVVSIMHDLGYTADEAQALMDRADVEIQGRIVTRARSKLLTRSVTQISNAIKVGVLDVSGAAAALARIGWPVEMAQGVAQLEASQANVDRIKHAIGSVRSAFHRGEIDSAFVSQQLLSIGIHAETVRAYVAAWQLERTPERKRRTAAAIVNDVAEARMTTEEALARLRNLGYEEPDRELYLADARAKVVQIVADQGIAASLSGKAKEEVLSQLARTSNRLSKRLVADLKVQAPIAKLQKWAKLGLMRHSEFRARLRLYGVEDGLIDTYWAEACAAKSAKCDPKEAAIGSPQGGGTGSDTTSSGANGQTPAVP